MSTQTNPEPTTTTEQTTDPISNTENTKSAESNIAVLGPPTSGKLIAPDDDDMYKSNSLYVGDLHESTNENMLFNHFNAVSPVGSVHVCRNMVTRRSLGYAYVNFHSIEDSEKAMEMLNYSPIQGRSCRIMWSNRNPGLRKSNRGNVFIKNLDLSVDNKQLHDTMATFGEILSCKIATFPGGKSKGYGFVHFVTDEAADAAIEKLNGTTIGDKEVFVARFQKRNNSRHNGEWTNLYVRNVPPDWTEEKLTSLFNEFGGVNSTKLNKPTSGQRHGYGFVDMDSHEAALNAVEALHQKYLVEEIDAEEKKDDKGNEDPEVGNSAVVSETTTNSDTKEDPKAPDDSKKSEDSKELEEATTTSTPGAEEPSVEEAEEGTDGGDKKNDEDFTQKIYLYVQRAQRREDREKEKREKEDLRRQERARKFQGMNIYIKNLDEKVSDDILRKEFDPFGTITSAKVMYSKGKEEDLF